MKTLKITDQEFSDLRSATFYTMHYWHNELEKGNNNELTRKVYDKYEKLYQLLHK